MNGFTLVELLIAMTLTAVIGMVLFSTYSMVMDNGKTVRNRVLERESERVFWGILDNDIAGLCLIDDKRSTLPPLSREPIVPSDAFYRLTETDKPQRQPFRRLHPARAGPLRRGRRLSVVRAGACPQCEVT